MSEADSESEATETDTVDCAIVGGGPAGMMLGFLLARHGVRVRVLEMHHDFDRDFRGDTVHASTLEVLDQIGLADALLELPHAKVAQFSFNVGDRRVPLVDFSSLNTRFPYVTVMPQSSFLEFLRQQASEYPGFSCHTGAVVRSLIRNDGTVEGVEYTQDRVEKSLRAHLVVACDGRFSRLRRMAGLRVSAGMEAKGATPPMDVAWFRVPRLPADPEDRAGFYLGSGRLLVMLERPDTWQVGYIFPKGDFSAVQAHGLDAFRASVVELAPWMGDSGVATGTGSRLSVLKDWHDIHLLSISSDRLTCWHRPGLLFLGDAAHVMSPVGGVGINYAIGDAVEACNVLADPLRKGAVTDAHLAEVQRRREGPLRKIQRFQRVIQAVVVERSLRSTEFTVPLPLRLITRIPGLRRIPPRIVALGFGRARLEQPDVGGG